MFIRVSFISLQAADRRDSLQVALQLQSQYEKLLAEFAEFLETAQTKLSGDDVITAVNLPDLRQHLDAHKVSDKPRLPTAFNLTESFSSFFKGCHYLEIVKNRVSLSTKHS